MPVNSWWGKTQVLGYFALRGARIFYKIKQYGSGGLLSKNSKNRFLPFFKNFFAGGVSSVRGFDSGTIGPKGLSTIDINLAPCDSTTLVNCQKVSLGGDTQVIGNLELFAPMPGIKDGSVRVSAFVDAGSVFGPNDYLGRFAKFNVSDFRYSAGIGVAWNSPLGPLKFSLAEPLNKKGDDKTQVFQFNLGTTF